MDENTTYVKLPEDLMNRLQALYCEVTARSEILSVILRQDTPMTEAATAFHDEYMEYYAAYRKLKNEISYDYLTDFDESSNWTADFRSGLVIVNAPTAEAFSPGKPTETKIELPDEFCAYIERLSFEYHIRRDVIANLLEQNIMPDNDNFRGYIRDCIERFAQYDIAKQFIYDTYVKPIATTGSWNLNFYINELVVTTDGGTENAE